MNNTDTKEIWKHIETLNHECGVLAQYQMSMKTDICWLKKFQWLILTAAMGGLIVGLFRLSVGI